ncbi:DNA-formamidopyrimidine glycosylase family protein [Pseudoxanthomonas mexicana]|uniref:DNA-formamidopyrimidine glycosylase family protein n=1 Tax=Pseudoxanthomonas mexicana TaxID=128785 RepID=UPI00398A5617
MPEGPETHYNADRLDLLLGGRTLQRLAFSDPALAQRQEQLQGRGVLGVRARGKATLIDFDNDLTLYTHSQLFGYWRFGTRQGHVPAGEPRVLLASERGWAALYLAPKVEVWPSATIEIEQSYLAKLGPDVLDPAVRPEMLAARLHQPAFRRRSLAALLLQQEFAAGMGNYLRSEVLFDAALLATHVAGALDAGQTQRLARALLEIPRRAYRAKFRDAPPPHGKDYLAHTARTFRFKVFERDGLPCPRCGATIVIDRLAGRRIYSCPGCQH